MTGVRRARFRADRYGWRCSRSPREQQRRRFPLAKRCGATACGARKVARYFAPEEDALTRVSRELGIGVKEDAYRVERIRPVRRARNTMRRGAVLKKGCPAAHFAGHTEIRYVTVRSSTAKVSRRQGSASIVYFEY